MGRIPLRDDGSAARIPPGCRSARRCRPEPSRGATACCRRGRELPPVSLFRALPALSGRSSRPGSAVRFSRIPAGCRAAPGIHPPCLRPGGRRVPIRQVPSASRKPGCPPRVSRCRSSTAVRPCCPLPLSEPLALCPAGHRHPTGRGWRCLPYLPRGRPWPHPGTTGPPKGACPCPPANPCSGRRPAPARSSG